MFDKLLKARQQYYLCELTVQNNSIFGMVSYVNMKERVIKIFINSKDPKHSFSEGTEVRIKLLKDDTEHLIHGIIESKEEYSAEQLLIIKVAEMKKFPNYRRAERFNYVCNAKLSDSSGTTTCKLMDVSSGGVLISSEKSIADHHNISVEIYPFADKSIAFIGSIMRAIQGNNIYTYGIKIDAISESSKEVFDELMTILQLKKNKVETDWKFHRKTNFNSHILIRRGKI